MLKGVPAYVVAAFPAYGVALVIEVEKWKGASLDTAAAYRIDLTSSK